MSSITLRIIDGPDRGKSCENLPLPVTVGREESNVLVLNDERVSRFHLKFFEESGKTLLVDLGSTNGTSVNGESIQIWSVRPGDLVLVGRTYILVGSKQEIAARLKAPYSAGAHRMLGDLKASSPPLPYLMGVSPEETVPVLGVELDSHLANSLSFTFARHKETSLLCEFTEKEIASLRSFSVPKVPSEIDNAQRLWLDELLLYITLRLRAVTAGILPQEGKKERQNPLLRSSEKKEKKKDPSVNSEETRRSVTLRAEQWQNLLDLYALLTEYRSEIKPQKDEPSRKKPL